jgi:tetratricopeptide (TPR) repeat protein
LGNVAIELREYDQAQQYYQQALAIYVEFGDRYSQANTYHQLGNVAIELREYEQAQQYYQQALAIYVEFGDRYSQSRTYYQLGILAEQLGELKQVKEYFLQALYIGTEFNEEYSMQTYIMPSLARIYQATQDPSILEAIAQVRGVTVEEVLAAVSDDKR